MWKYGLSPVERHLGKKSLSVRSALYSKRNSTGGWPELGKELVGGRAEARRYERERRWLQIRHRGKEQSQSCSQDIVKGLVDKQERPTDL